MKTINDTYAKLSALIIDDHPSQRQQLRWHLSQLGIEAIEQAGNAADALTALTKRAYDLVLCDYNLDSNLRGEGSNGQQLLEHARSTGVLGPNTIYMMVSGNSDYRDIAATVENKPDAYLIKPVTTRLIEERLQRLLDRQKALSAIGNRQRMKDHAGAVLAADRVMVETPEYMLNALQMKGESQLEAGLFEDALATYEQAIGASMKLDWAHYGKAKALKGLKCPEQARTVLLDLVARNRLYTSAYELLAVLAEDAGDDREAVSVLRRSLQELPSPRRARALAEVAYRAGDAELARSNFEAVIKSTKGSFVSRPSDVLMLAQSAIDMGDHKAALKVVEENMASLSQDETLEGVAFALQAQAYAGTGDMITARKAAALAKQSIGKPTASTNTLLVAKGLLAAGDQSGIALLQASVKGDHENTKLLSLARKVLKDTGHEELSAHIVDGAADSVKQTLDSALKLRRSGEFMQAKEMVDQALAEMPDNTGVLIEASQVYLLALMRQERKDMPMVLAVRGFLEKLERLLPGNERVAAQHAYFRKVMSSAPR